LNGITIDAGGLIAVERGDRRVFAIIARALQDGLPVAVPATALAQVIRNPARQARLSQFVRDSTTHVIPLDQDHATMVGRLLAQTGTSDIVDAHVAVCALRNGNTVITSDPGDLSRLVPELPLFLV
jgi:predicted nucleic acid-binding protein